MKLDERSRSNHARLTKKDKERMTNAYQLLVLERCLSLAALLDDKTRKELIESLQKFDCVAEEDKEDSEPNIIV